MIVQMQKDVKMFIDSRIKEKYPDWLLVMVFQTAYCNRQEKDIKKLTG